ncbi:MAG TPA: ACT domain-containing protein [Nocardioides sp.]
MTLHGITVLGHDRPGIIAETTGILAGLGLNLEDSSMTLLRGHFAMTLICEGTTSAAAGRHTVGAVDDTVRTTSGRSTSPPYPNRQRKSP